MRVTILGSGTSSGVPVAGCRCEVCTSTDPKDKRLRSSIFLEVERTTLSPTRDTEPSGSLTTGSAKPESNCVGILVDTSTDFRQQVLREQIIAIDGVLFTHAHADHICGLDDLRPFNFLYRRAIDLYAEALTASRIETMFDYAFHPDPKYLGGALPQLNMQIIDPKAPFLAAGIEVTPIPIVHGTLGTLGYRIGDFAYLTDCSTIPESSYELLQNLAVLIIDGLRERPHPTHLNFAGAVKEIEKIKPQKSYLTHVGHDFFHDSANELLRSMTSLEVELAYDGLSIDL